MKGRNKYSTLAEKAAEAAKRLRSGENLDIQIIVGPVVHDPEDDGRWYFAVASADHDGAHFDAMVANDEALSKEFRNAFTCALVQTRPIVIHDVDDELALARLAEALWPSPKTTKIRADIEAENQRAAR